MEEWYKDSYKEFSDSFCILGFQDILLLEVTLSLDVSIFMSWCLSYISIYMSWLHIIVDWCTFNIILTILLLFICRYDTIRVWQYWSFNVSHFSQLIYVCSRAPHSVLYPPMILSQFFRVRNKEGGRGFTSLFWCLNCALIAFDTSSNDIYSNHTIFCCLRSYS